MRAWPPPNNSASRCEMNENETVSVSPRSAIVRRTSSERRRAGANAGRGNARLARQRHRRDVVVPLDPQHLLDEVGLALDVAAPGWRLDRQIAAGQLLDRATQCRQDGGALLHRHVEAAEARRAPGAQHIAPPPFRHRAGNDDLRRLAAAQIEHQPRRDFDPVGDKGRVEAALKAITRVAGDVQLAAGRGGADRIEQRRFDKHLGRRFGAAGGLAADNAAEAPHSGPIRDRGDFRIERVFLAVEGEQGLAGPGETHTEIAVEPPGIKDVQRPVEIEGQEIGDVDQRRNRPQPDRFEPPPQPGRARPVPDAAQVTPEKQRAGRTILDMDGDRRAERAANRRRIERLQLPEPGRRQIPGDAADAETVGPVRRDLDVDDRVVETQPIDVSGPDRRLRRDLDDAVVIVAEAEFIGRAQHAARGDAADRPSP